MGSTGKVLIYGGNGALGRVCVSAFKAKKYWVCSVDLATNDDADISIAITETTNWEKQNEQVQDGILDILKEEKLDGIFCVAGGWAGGKAESKVLVKNSNLMWMQSVWSSTICASLACKHLKKDGILTLPGAFPATSGTSGMVGYGMAKAAVHQLTKSLSEDSGLPEHARALCILPVTLDTPMNRKWMKDADQSSWTPLEFIADLFDSWLNNKNDAPVSGSLVKVTTAAGISTTTIV